FTQFEGEFKASVLGGSVTNWRRASGSVFANGGHIQSQLNSTSEEVIEASVSDHFAGRGGVVFYLGGHQYNGSTESDLAGQRMFLNAFLTPATTFENCNVFADAAGNLVATALRYTICLGDSVGISLPSGPNGPETYVWSPATGLNRTTGAIVQANPAATTTYTVQATSSTGTVRYLGVTVVVRTASAVSIAYEGCVPLVGQPVQLHASPLGPEYQWDFGDGSPLSVVASHRYLRPGRYTVRLSGSSTDSCPVQASIVVEVLDFQAPNIFTPNHDGANDTFQLPGLPASSIQIFNRWGRRVYAADRYANDWDGADQAAGIYYYLLQPTGCATTIKGWVELVR
ncbi:MAG: T9SS type B sorting domain-containing protein, partial [Hymenobacter sp.]